MKKILAIQGKKDTGKTKSIVKITEWLTGNYSVTEILEEDTRKEVYRIIKIKNYLIGICSQGDPNSNLEYYLDIFYKRDCNIIICACRTYGMTVDWINNYKKRYDIEFIQSKWEKNPTYKALQTLKYKMKLLLI